jgi:type IV secretory pathway VirB2 component (pilin)
MLRLFLIILFCSLSFDANLLAVDPPVNNGLTAADYGTAVSPMGVMCALWRLFAGPIGKVMALLCLVSIGVAFFMAKITWTTALTVVVGIGAIFGGPKIVGFLTGSRGDVCGGYAANAVTDI